jgi:hypothetical protein
MRMVEQPARDRGRRVGVHPEYVGELIAGRPVLADAHSASSSHAPSGDATWWPVPHAAWKRWA